jgi:hypothetical protein
MGLDSLFRSTAGKIASGIVLAGLIGGAVVWVRGCCSSGIRKMLAEYEQSPAVQYEKSGDFTVLNRDPEAHSYLGLNSDISGRYDKIRRFQAIPQTIASVRSKAKEYLEVMANAKNTKPDNFVKIKLSKIVAGAVKGIDSLPDKDSWSGRYNQVLNQVENSARTLNNSQSYVSFLASKDNSDIIGIAKETKYSLVIESVYTKRVKSKSKSNGEEERVIRENTEIPVNFESFRRARIGDKVDRDWAVNTGIKNAHQRRLTLSDKKEKYTFTAVSRKNFTGEKISEEQYNHIKRVMELLDIRNSRRVSDELTRITIDEPFPRKVIFSSDVFSQN